MSQSMYYAELSRRIDRRENRHDFKREGLLRWKCKTCGLDKIKCKGSYYFFRNGINHTMNQPACVNFRSANEIPSSEMEPMIFT